jgi:hypothetical protein
MSGSKLSNPAEKNKTVDAPLAMTVHDMPAPGDVAQADERRTVSGRLKMAMVMLVCAAPVMASYFTYYVVRPESRRNYGELVTPPVDMPDLQARDLQGTDVPLASLKGQWLLLTVAGGACDAACQQNLYFQRQLREVLGKDKDRLDRIWLINDDAPVAPGLLPALSQAQALRVNAGVLKNWLKPGAGHELADHLYVVDPMGNWMMRFPAHMDVTSASKAKRDLERLMRASSSWDQAGR